MTRETLSLEFIFRPFLLEYMSQRYVLEEKCASTNLRDAGKTARIRIRNYVIPYKSRAPYVSRSSPCILARSLGIDHAVCRLDPKGPVKSSTCT